MKMKYFLLSLFLIMAVPFVRAETWTNSLMYCDTVDDQTEDSISRFLESISFRSFEPDFWTWAVTHCRSLNYDGRSIGIRKIKRGEKFTYVGQISIRDELIPTRFASGDSRTIVVRKFESTISGLFPLTGEPSKVCVMINSSITPEIEKTANDCYIGYSQERERAATEQLRRDEAAAARLRREQEKAARAAEAAQGAPRRGWFGY